MSVTPEEVFWSKVEVRGSNECWPWKRHRLKTGYGRAQHRKYQTTAHRHAYAIAHGLPHLAPKVHVRHTCDNPPCCNPAHLLLGDATSNAADRVARGRSRKRAERDVCVHDHRLTEENTWTTKEGFSQCRTCHRERTRARRAKLRSKSR